jgi:hypothetical protein
MENTEEFQLAPPQWYIDEKDDSIGELSTIVDEKTLKIL